MASTAQHTWNGMERARMTGGPLAANGGSRTAELEWDFSSMLANPLEPAESGEEAKKKEEGGKERKRERETRNGKGKTEKKKSEDSSWRGMYGSPWSMMNSWASNNGLLSTRQELNE